MSAPEPSKRSQRGLDWLNFFIADVETAFGPFVAVWLSSQHWSQGAIGMVISLNSGIALATQVPAGWVVDHVSAKRVVLGVSIACIAGGSLLIALFPHLIPVLIGEALHGVTGGTVHLVIAAIGLGLVGNKAYSKRVGRNHRFDSFGNAATAGAMGVAGQFVSKQVPFFIGAALCVPATIAMLSIRGKEIDPTRARQGKPNEKPGRWRDLLRNRPLLTFALVMFLFQFANASLLPLAGERLAATHKGQSELVTSALVVVPQIVTALIATWIARKSDDWGRRAMLTAGLAALVLRAALFALAINPWLLVASGVFGGLTAAIVGILMPLVVADCMKGTGHYNFGLGAVGALGGVGATVSTTALGYVAQGMGYVYGFGVIAVVAIAAIVVVWLVMPETAEAGKED